MTHIALMRTLDKKEVQEMKTYVGGQRVTRGYYMNRSNLEFTCVDAGGGVLSGDQNKRYVRLPLLGVMVAGPLIGFLYVIAMPIMACSTFIYWSVRKLAVRLKVQMGRQAAWR